MRTIDHWGGGKPVEGTSGRFGPVTDPATGARTGQVALAGAADVDAAVAAALGAAPGWRASPLCARRRVLFAYRDLLHRHRAELAEIVTSEHGKVVSDATGEVDRGLEVVEFACGIPQLLKGGYTE